MKCCAKRETRCVHEQKSVVQCSIADRVIIIDGRIDFSTLINVQHALIQIQDVSFEPILLIIRHSHGGDALAGMMIAQTLKHTIAPVFTAVDNLAESAAFIIFLGGTRRYVSNNARLAPHEMILSIQGKLSMRASDFSSLEKYFEHFNMRAMQMIKETSHLSDSEIKQIFYSNDCISALRARKMGIATHMVVSKTVLKILRPNKGKINCYCVRRRLKQKKHK